MVCRKCGFKLISNSIVCPNCGGAIKEINSSINVNKKNIKEQEEIKNETSVFSTMFIILILLFVVGSGVYFYNNYKDSKINIVDANNVLNSFREKGYQVIGLFDDINNLEETNLISDFEYKENKAISNSKKLFCSQFSNLNLSFEIKDGQVVLVNKGTNETVIISNIENPKYIMNYNKSSCTCSDYNLVVLTKDGMVYISENTKTNYNSVNSMFNSIKASFKLIKTEVRIKNFSVSSYVGEVTSCKENVLVLQDENNNELIYKNNEVINANAQYSIKIHNVGFSSKDNETVNNNLFINPDRTMQVGDTYEDKNLYITEIDGTKIKYYGAFSYENEDKSLNMYILSTNGYLYNVNFDNHMSNITAKIVKKIKVKNIGYKFDLNDMQSKMLIVYEDNSHKEFNNILETYGICTIN